MTESHFAVVSKADYESLLKKIEVKKEKKYYKKFQKEMKKLIYK